MKPYKVVEVNPFGKKEIKWSDYKKVPILVVDGEQLVESLEIKLKPVIAFDCGMGFHLDTPLNEYKQSSVCWLFHLAAEMKLELVQTAKKGYVGILSSRFRDFLLKPDLLRDIVDSGFEHPLEGKMRFNFCQAFMYHVDVYQFIDWVPPSDAATNDIFNSANCTPSICAKAPSKAPFVC